MSFLGDEEEEDDQDSLKEALLETSPYLLGLTMLVSILHSVFELLAFKNGKCEWKNVHMGTSQLTGVVERYSGGLCLGVDVIQWPSR